MGSERVFGYGGGVRWTLADADGPQAALFPEDDVVDRHVGRGEFAGLEFLHVNAKSIINEVPAASHLPFRWTVNAYRGCSHACVYCQVPETPVLLADGRHRPLGDLRVGDGIYGTVQSDSHRRYVRTEVLATWRTTKPAHRVVLEDGTSLVASGDHRYLTKEGWKFVTGTGCGGRPRPHLTTNDSLLGPGRFASQPVDDVGYRRGCLADRWALDGVAVDTGAPLRVVAVEGLGLELPMCDITTGTGDFIAGGVVSHNCFARPTHDYLGLNIGPDFDTKLVVKVNAVERLRAELKAKRWRGDHIAMGTNTDPYQRAEGKYHLTRGIVQALTDARNPFSILTKSTLILRDLDLLRQASAVTDVRVNLSIGTLDEATWKATEPGTPHPRQRVEAVRRLVDAGIETGVLVAPIIPGMSDGDERLTEVVRACVEAGAASVSAISLFLKPGVREHWMAWLRDHRPDLVPMYERRYARGARLPKDEQAPISDLVRRIAAEAAIDTADGDLRRIARQQRLGPGRTPAAPAPDPPPPPPTLL